MASNNVALWSSEQLAHFAAASLVAEARLTPKPGLVDRRTNGAHTDMDLGTFLASAAALEPLFAEYVSAGVRWGHAENGEVTEPAALADELRRIGVRAEHAMFTATDGVNTHKGANFMFALVLGAVGAVLGERGADGASAGAGAPLFSSADTARTLELVSAMGACLLDRDVRALLTSVRTGGAQLTHGEAVYLEQGLKGARGEAARGYPLLTEALLPYFRLRADGREPNDDASEPLLRALVKLMAQLEDTNVVHRGGMGALVEHRAYCRELDARELNAEQLIEVLVAYDDELTRRNVSPGGAADLLSLGVFFGLLEGVFTLDALDYRRAWTFVG